MNQMTIDKLSDTILKRLAEGDQGSYTRKLAAQGIKRVAQKVGEEGVEVALAALAGDKDEVVNEAADLVYHLLVLLAVSDVPLERVMAELNQRMKP